MRVISGNYKGKKLNSVKGLKVRPTSDKLKSAIFDVLFSLGVGRSLDGITALDVFAGSGALGIEALSMGAAKCHFIDKDRDSINAIENNLGALKIEREKYAILNCDFRSAIKNLSKNDIRFDLIFIDPPYKNNLTLEVLENINIYAIVSSVVAIVCEHSAKEILPERVKAFKKVTEKFYGDKVLSFYTINSG